MFYMSTVYQAPLQSCVGFAAEFRLIFKHLVMVKAKLGLNVGMSIQKFKVSARRLVMASSFEHR